MKVTLVSHSPDFVGGAERSLLEIARYLNSKSSVELTVILPSRGELESQLKRIGVACKLIGFEWGVYHGNETKEEITGELGKMGAIYKYLESDRPDVVMTNTVVIPWFAYACKQLGIPHVWFIRETIEDGDKIPIYPNLEQAVSFIDSHSDKVLVGSSYMKTYYSRLLGSNKDIDIVHPSINPGILQYSEQSESRAAKKPFKIIIFSSISPNKNQLEVLRAIKLLEKRTHDFHLTIMGAVIIPDYRDKLARFVDVNGLNNYVSFVEQTNEPYKVVAEQDICVVPSINEPFGRVTVEAMLLKKVVVASDSTGNREVAGDAPGAFLYKLGDAEALADRLYRLIRDPHSMVGLGQQAHDYAVKKFLNDDSLDLLYTVFEKATRTKTPKHSSWVDHELIDAARDASLSRRRMAEAEQKIIKERKKAALQIQERDRLLSNMLNSKRWRFVSFLLKPLDWFR